MVAVALAPQHGHDGETADGHEHVGEEVVERRAGAPGRAGGHPQQNEPGVIDGRVRQHPLHVALAQGDEGAQDQREHGQPVDDRTPVGLDDAERGEEDAQQGGEGARLGHGRHESGHGGRGTLVHVRRPHVEGHRRHLEGEADQHQGEPGQQQAVGQDDVLGQVVRNLGQVRRPGGPVGQRDAVDEDGRGEAAQDEVLERRLAGCGALVVEGGQHVQGEGEDLEAEEDDDQVVGHPHHHGAGGREHRQHVELRAVRAFPAQVAVRHERGEQHGDGDQHGDEHAEAVHDDGVFDVGVRAVLLHVVPLPERDAERAARDDDRGDGAHAYPQRLAHQRGQAEQDDGAADHDDGRQDGEPADGRHRDGVRDGVRRRVRCGVANSDAITWFPPRL